MLVRCAERSLRPIRHRSAGGFVIRRPDQLHDGFEAKALSDRGEPASTCTYGLARKTGQPSVRQNTVSDLRDFALRAGWPPHRADARRLSRLRCILSAHDSQPDADATRGRHRAEGTPARTRLPLGEAGGMQTLGTHVAFSWGFSSSSHFSRVFREYFGVVPSAIHKAQHASLSADFPCE